MRGIVFICVVDYYYLVSNCGELLRKDSVNHLVICLVKKVLDYERSISIHTQTYIKRTNLALPISIRIWNFKNFDIKN